MTTFAGDTTDEQLVARFVAGDREAFEQLVARHQRRVYAIAYRYFGNAADAEDAAQEAFLTLLRRAETFGGTSSFATWMYRVTVNTCNDIARKRGRRPQSSGQDAAELADRPLGADPIAQRELALELGAALAALDEDTRTAIVLHDVQGVPYADIAQRLGVAVGTVKSRIHRGHARLATLLDQQRSEPPAPSRPPSE